jgi:hypothetical protein
MMIKITNGKWVDFSKTGIPVKIAVSHGESR